jgi:hypothetical protein
MVKQKVCFNTAIQFLCAWANNTPLYDSSGDTKQNCWCLYNQSIWFRYAVSFDP